MVASILLLAFLFQSYSASRLKSPTFDEPLLIPAGLSYVQTGIFRLDIQQPPLLQLAGVSLVLSGIRWPTTAEASQMLMGNEQPESEWRFGDSIIEENGADKVLFWSRLPFIFVSALGGLLLYLFGRELVGEAAALGALFLYALDPTIIAHSFMAKTDVGLAVFAMLFLWALWSYLRRPSWGRLFLSGVALGLASSYFPLADCCRWRPCVGRRKLRTKAVPASLTGLLWGRPNGPVKSRPARAVSS
jgi:hypothetical protein